MVDMDGEFASLVPVLLEVSHVNHLPVLGVKIPGG